MTWRRVLLGLLAVLLALLAAVAPAALELRATVLRSVPAPESPTGLRALSERTFAREVVVAAHPEAARIGAQVLAAGGTAMDAAVAVQATLSLVEPQSSGLGGGAFLLYWDARAGTLAAYDGRETAPAAATPSLFLGANGKPLSFPQALVGGRSVGVPGVVRLLEDAQRRFGVKPWSTLFDGAAALAERGFAVTPRLNGLLAMDPILPAVPLAGRYFFPGTGWPVAVGTHLVNAPLARTFRQIAAEGARGFYEGPIAWDMVSAVKDAKRPAFTRSALNLVARAWGIPSTGEADVAVPGTLSLDDLRGYRALERTPLCAPYRTYRVCGLPPPAGGVSVLEELGLLDRYALSALQPADRTHVMLEAQALADVDHDRWSADPAFAPVPTAGLLSAGYLKERGKDLTVERALKTIPPGLPPGATAAVDEGEAFEVPSTSHFVIVDADGSIASMTTSVEFGFGSHVMVDGFLLNNQLTDFAFTPEVQGRRVYNAVQAGKRPRSSMTPIIVFDARTGKPVLALGSPGGPRIVSYVGQTLIGVLDEHLSPQAAVSQPHVAWVKGEVEVEDVGWPDHGSRAALVHALEARGHRVKTAALNSGLHAVGITPKGLIPGIDPRREGDAQGR